jgi:hypothetical protein
MKIAICGSLSFAKEMAELRNKLEAIGHEVYVPYSAEKIMRGELSGEEVERAKENGTFYKMTMENDAIRRWYDVIEKSDGILVANYDKKGIKNYIGGSAFLEMGFAHVMNKKVFLLNPIPDASYEEEILSMQPVIINGDLNRIQ